MQDALGALLREDREPVGAHTGSWTARTVEGDDYLIHLIQDTDGLAAGAYVNLTSLLSQLSAPNEHVAFHILPYAPEETSGDTVILSQKSAAADIWLCETIERSWLRASLPLIHRFLPLIGIFLLLLPAFCTYLVRRIVVRPLRQLTSDIDRIHSGDVDYRIPERPEAQEIQVVNQALNAMVDEIQSLKVHVYEAALNEQKARLRNLQLQIRPHFLINSLNMIYNSIESGKEKQACQLILHTTDYFRYMERIQENLVPLQDEIKHIGDYLDIQALRYEGRIEREISVDPMIADMLIPPVLIQCFIENAIKYALNMEQKLKIRVRVTAFEKEFSPYAKIEISDNGGGFPPELLEQINAGKRIHDDRGSHTGISNVIQRLSLIFGDQASWSFYNDPGAAAVFTLPATFPD